MNFTFFLLVLTLLNVASSCDVYDSNSAVCAEDLDEVCGVSSFPDSIQSLYDSRSCLKKNKDFISKDCLDYLELDKPSVVDSCFVEMKSYCFTVVPGSFRLHNCLSAVPEEDLSPNCREALIYDQKVIDEKVASMENTPTLSSYWNLLDEYMITVKDIIYSRQMEIASASASLRGSLHFFNSPSTDNLGLNEVNYETVKNFFTNADQPVVDEK